jgi:uncharacterized membrane protein
LTDIIFLALLFAHIGTVVLWMGASILYVSVLGPSMTKLAGSSRADLLKVIGPVYQRYIVTNATIALVAGLILYAYVKGYITHVSSSVALGDSGTPWIQAGIIFGLAAYIIAVAVVTRANGRLVRLIGQVPVEQAGTGAPSGEMARLQRRVAMGAGLQAVLLVIALLCMVVGANL